MPQQGAEPIPAWHLLELPGREGSEQDPAQGESQEGSQPFSHALETREGHPGNHQELGWTQQLGDFEGRVAAQVKFLIPN